MPHSTRVLCAPESEQRWQMILANPATIFVCRTSPNSADSKRMWRPVLTLPRYSRVTHPEKTSTSAPPNCCHLQSKHLRMYRNYSSAVHRSPNRGFSLDKGRLLHWMAGHTTGSSVCSSSSSAQQKSRYAVLREEPNVGPTSVWPGLGLRSDGSGSDLILTHNTTWKLIRNTQFVMWFCTMRQWRHKNSWSNTNCATCAHARHRIVMSHLNAMNNEPWLGWGRSDCDPHVSWSLFTRSPTPNADSRAGVSCSVRVHWFAFRNKVRHVTLSVPVIHRIGARRRCPNYFDDQNHARNRKCWATNTAAANNCVDMKHLATDDEGGGRVPKVKSNTLYKCSNHAITHTYCTHHRVEQVLDNFLHFLTQSDGRQLVSSVRPQVLIHWSILGLVHCWTCRPWVTPLRHFIAFEFRFVISWA